MRPEHRLTFVGDTGVGKTSLLQTYQYHEFVSNTYLQYYLEPHIDEVTTKNGEIFSLKLEDTQANPDYDKLRPLIYPHTSCFVLCYSVDSPSSLESISHKWLPELKEYVPKRLPPFIILGLKSDLDHKVTIEQVEQESERLKAAAHLECSALKMHGLEEVAQAAAEAIAHHTNQKSKCCRIT